MEGAFAVADDFAVLTHDSRPSRREYVVRVTGGLREALDGLATRYNLYTTEGGVRDAEIVRVLLVCALTEGWTPREQAAVALYVNGLMLVSQSLWLGQYNIRDDLAKTMRAAVRTWEDVECHESRPGNPCDPDRERFHVKVDNWIRDRLAVVAVANNFVRKDGTILDSILVATLIRRAVEQPKIYRQAFVIYASGIAQVRQGLAAGLATVYDALRSAIVAAATGGS